MKIAIYIHSLGMGGAERVTVHLANYWASQGHNVVIITNALLDFNPYPIADNVTHECLELHGSTNSFRGALASNIKRIVALRRCIKQHKIQKIVSFCFTANITLALARTGLNGLIAIGSERCYPPLESDSKLWYFLRRYTYRLLDSVVVQTGKTNSWISKKTLSRLTVTIPNPVIYPLPVTDPIVSTAQLKDKLVILAVGRLEDQKQFEHLLHAFSRIHQKFSNWCVVIVGEGYDRYELEQLAMSLDLKNSVHMPGKVGNVGAWYDRADIFVLCSKFEGFPNVLLEAMAYGNAVVSYDCDTGPADIIEHNSNGLLVESDNIDELANSIEIIMSNPVLREQFKKNAGRVAQKYSSESIFRSWDEVLGLVCESEVNSYIVDSVRH